MIGGKAFRQHSWGILAFLLPVLIYASCFGVFKYPYRMIDADVVKVLDPFQLADNVTLENLDHPSFTNTLFFSWGFVLFQKLDLLGTNEEMLENVSQESEIPRVIYAGRILNIFLSILLLCTTYGLLFWYFRQPYYALALTFLIAMQYGFLRSVGFIRSETTAAFFSLFAMLIFLIQLRQKSVYVQTFLFLISGLFLGLGYFSKIQMLPVFGLVPAMILYLAFNSEISLKKLVSFGTVAVVSTVGFYLYQTYRVHWSLFNTSYIPDILLTLLAAAKYFFWAMAVGSLIAPRLVRGKIFNTTLYSAAVAVGFFFAEKIYFISPGFNHMTGWKNLVGTFRWMSTVKGSYVKVSDNVALQIFSEFFGTWLKDYYVLYSPITLIFLGLSVWFTKGRSRVIVSILAFFWMVQCGFSAMRYFSNQYIMLSYVYLIAIFAIAIHDSRPRIEQLFHQRKKFFIAAFGLLLGCDLAFQALYFYRSRNTEIHLGIYDYGDRSDDYRFSSKLTKPVLDFSISQRPYWIRFYREKLCGDTNLDTGVTPQCLDLILSEIREKSDKLATKQRKTDAATSTLETKF